MQDRIPLFPGRVQLTPVAGQENIYDMTRADQPTQAGTPLSKASLLKDATAALYGLGTEAVPDDVLAAIKTLISGVDTKADSKAKIQMGSYSGAGRWGSSDPTILNFGFSPVFVIIMNGNLYTSGGQGKSVSGVAFFARGSDGVQLGQTSGNTISIKEMRTTWTDTSIKFYTTASASSWQMDDSQTTYKYIAIA